MSWIRMILPAEAEGELHEAYGHVGVVRDRVDNILAVHSLSPAAMRAHYDLYRICMAGTAELSRAQREMIAVAVSAANGCRYCVTHHSRGLSRITRDDRVAAALAADYQQAPVTDAERALLEYAVKLASAPANTTAADVDSLRSHGWSDRAIHDAALVAAYYAFVNRIALGLGVELEK